MMKTKLRKFIEALGLAGELGMAKARLSQQR